MSFTSALNPTIVVVKLMIKLCRDCFMFMVAIMAARSNWSVNGNSIDFFKVKLLSCVLNVELLTMAKSP